jgi:2-hydroxy-6-oxonona-2,4-dienedioate hydrolase
MSPVKTTGKKTISHYFIIGAKMVDKLNGKEIDMAPSRRFFLKASVAGLAALPGRTLARPSPPNVMEKYVDVEGIRTRYFEAGSGENLVLVHGGSIGSVSYTADMWDLNLEGLSQQVHVYAPDKLGCGHTDNPKSDSDYTMGAQTRHIYRFMLAVGIEKACLVGLSRGALPVARIAVRHPEIVQSLIILDSRTLAPTDPSIGSNTNPFYTRLTANAPAVPTAEYVRREPDANSYFQSHITDEYVDKLLKAALLPKAAEAREKMKQLGDQYRTDSARMKAETHDMIRAGKLKAPTLILWAFNDPSAPLDLGLQLLDVIAPAHPDTQMHVLNQAAHYLCRDQLEKFNSVVTAFVKNAAAA